MALSNPLKSKKILMADDEGFGEGHLGGAGSFSQLLFADDLVGLDMDDGFNHKHLSFSSINPPKMLCFGDYKENCEAVVVPEKKISANSVRASQCNNHNSVNAMSKSNKKRNELGQESVQRCASTGAGAPVESQGNPKKTKSSANPTTPASHAKVRKEKLGERITALQQLVSPYGKTDTASVLHEATGYIRFLQEQVQVLCSPYLQRLPSSPSVTEGEEEEMEKIDLRSRGLCLVPVASTVHVGSSNGADFWSPAMGSVSSSSLSKQ
ncbi:transcription factor bHLH113-like [Malania oleifera]|uniref:transcription factor bHLH113-like n=1 Tax=Malania oleifera TaxID=397392 RepID=UPI0025ADF3C8|nr:transcription factor bHLH113-like [Malania oleifera]